MKSFILALFLSIVIYGINSCSKIDNYKQYITKDMRYAGRVDTAFVRSGYYRAALLLVRGKDPLVNKARIYWDNRTDSLDVDIKQDTTNVVIENLEEKVYNFEIYTFDNIGNRSVVSNIIGSVYGDDYTATLHNRRIISVDRDKLGSVILKLESPYLNEVGFQIKYTDEDRGEVTQIIPVTQSTVVIPPSYAGETNLYFKSLYKPDSLPMIDSLSIGFSTLKMPAFEKQVDKSKFKKVVLPTDITDAHGWVMENLWNESYEPNGFATQPSMPQWYTIDLGNTQRISRFKTWQAPDRLYVLQSIKRFELWGALSPNPDGSWDGWTKLATCQSVKPSGLPVGQNSAEDIAYARAGEEFPISGPDTPIRYIRIKVLETWGGEPWSTMAELTFWTRDK